MDELGLDQASADVVKACADLVGRAGALSFEIGHSDPDDGPVTWHTMATYREAEVVASGHADPAAAALALARRLLTGAKCKCGRLVALSIDGAWAPPDSATMLDGSDPRELRTAGQCLWMLEGARWQSSCDAPPLLFATRG